MDVTKHPLLKKCVEVMQAIEECGASPAITNAVIKASELLNDIGKSIEQLTGEKQAAPAEALPTKPQSTVIRPSVGRVVHYWPNTIEAKEKPTIAGQPYSAEVVGVWGDSCVNLRIHDANGNPYSKTSVPLIQPGMPKPESGGYCEWMEYQIRTNRQ